MNLVSYHKLRTAVQHSAAAGGAEELLEVERRLWAALVSAGAFADVEVDATDDPDRLVIAMCRFPGQVSVNEAAARLERVWLDRVRYDFWEAHTLIVARGQVELEAASRASVTGHYVSVHVVAQQSLIPAQRVPWPAQRSTVSPAT
jgi:hypothetical protein